jgi:hypothetical protein
VRIFQGFKQRVEVAYSRAVVGGAKRVEKFAQLVGLTIVHGRLPFAAAAHSAAVRMPMRAPNQIEAIVMSGNNHQLLM